MTTPVPPQESVLDLSDPSKLPLDYPWSALEQAQRDLAIERKDANLLPVCTERYFAWRDATRERREDARGTNPPPGGFWAAPGCKGIPDQLIRGPRSGPGPGPDDELRSRESTQMSGEGPEQEPKRQSSPILDMNYDDSWVANIPDVVSGYKGIRILTPKNTSCIVTPEINFQSPRRSMDEFLNDPPSIDSLEKELQSIPGVPSDIILGFSSKPLDPEIYAARQQILNEARLRNGCTKMGGPVKIGNPEDQ